MRKKLYRYKRFWLLVLITTYLLLGFFYVPKVIKQQLQQQLSSLLNMQADVEKVDFNPLTFTVLLHNFNLTDSQQNNWYNSATTGINFDPLNLMWGEWKFSDLKLVKPEININIDEASQLLVPALPEIQSSTENSQALNLSIENISLDDGRMNIQAGNVKNNFALNIKSLAIQHEKLSLADEDTHFNITLTTEHDETIALTGLYNHAKAVVQSAVQLTNWQASTLNQILPDNLMLNNQAGLIQADGQIDWQLELSPVLDFSRIDITDYAALWQSAVQVSHLDSSVLGLNVDTQRQKISIESITSPNADWQLNWPIEGPANNNAEDPTDYKPAWQIQVNTIQLANWPITLNDQKLNAELDISLLDFTVTEVNNQSTPFQLTGQINFPKNGTVKISSEQSLTPFTARSEVSLTDFALAPLSPWISAETGLVFTHGNISTTQKLALDQANFNINGALTLKDANIQNLLAQNIATVGELVIGATAISSKDKSITIDQITLDQAEGSIIIDAENNINVKNLNSKQPNDSQASSSESDWVIKVGAVNIKDTSTTLIDQSIVPEVKTSISELNGQIKGLSSESLSKADVDIKGKFNQFSPLNIKGQINPLSSDAYTDLKVTIEDLDLLPFSPYSTTFVAFPINGGKLNLELEYSLNQHELNGKNNLLFKQFKLGDRTTSPDAINLPLKLAVTLLSDMNGEMKINLPVSGNLTDPEFSYGGLIGKAIFKLITNIVASPFKILGALIPNPDPNLSDIQFTAGSAELVATEQNKLNQIAEIMAKKTELNLQLNPKIDHGFDRSALKEQQLLSLTPFSHFDAADEPTQQWLISQLTPEELTIYTAEDGKIAHLQIWHKLVEQQKVNDEAFNTLTEQRNLNIKNYLIESSGIAADKIFIEQAQFTENNQAMIKIGVSR